MKILELAQGSPPWLEWRYDGVGASDIASIIGVSPFKDATREDVMREKVTRQGREASYAMRRGNRLEPTARAAYQRETPSVVKVCCVQHELYPWAIASLDGLCHYLHGDERNKWVLELKCPNHKVHALALDGEVVSYYRPQIQWQLFCANVTFADFVSYSEHSKFAEGDRLAVVPVKRDEEVIGPLVNAAAEFWMEVLDQRDKVQS